ncbi:MAG: MogA/MoaB family molybdenum cofactor biosynthesis protein [Acidimicrobiales bacterium]
MTATEPPDAPAPDAGASDAPVPASGASAPYQGPGSSSALLRAKILTVSDGVAAGVRQDSSGPALAEVLEGHGFEVIEQRQIADGTSAVAAALETMTSGFSGLVVTTGGTGFGPRDETPEGTRLVLDRDAPGLAEAMRLTSPLGRLSRGIAGTKDRALVCNLPGSSRGAVECLEAVLDVIPHALDLLGGGRPH